MHEYKPTRLRSCKVSAFTGKKEERKREREREKYRNSSFLRGVVKFYELWSEKYRKKKKKKNACEERKKILDTDTIKD